MTARRHLALVSLALLVATAACGDDSSRADPARDFTDRDASFTVDPGERFTITLESNATTGYAWQLWAELPARVVRLVDDVYVAPDTDLVGVAGYQEFTFGAVGDGSTPIELWYVRSFDDPPAPADQAQFEVIVGTGAGDEPPGDEDAITAHG